MTFYDELLAIKNACCKHEPLAKDLMPPLSKVRLAEFYKAYATANMLCEKYFIYFGEIPNMPGHCVVFGESGRMYSGYHPETFLVIPEEET